MWKKCSSKEKNQAKKRNILERIGDLKKSNTEKDGTIKVFSGKVEKLEEKSNNQSRETCEAFRL